jgi:hypothetical protein
VGVTALKNCIICEIYPGHEGNHYTSREITSRLFSMRVRAPGTFRWTALPQCSTAEGHPIVASAHRSDHPEAHSIDGCWLCVQTPEFEEEVEGSELKPAVESSEGAAETSATIIEETTTPDLETEFEFEEAVFPIWGSESDKGEMIIMASSDKCGYLAWAPSGLQVDIRTVAADEGKGVPVEDLKLALASFEALDGTLVRLTETLGQNEAWISIAASGGRQGALLMAAGRIMEMLVQGKVYDEVLLNLPKPPEEEAARFQRPVASAG